MSLTFNSTSSEDFEKITKLLKDYESDLRLVGYNLSSRDQADDEDECKAKDADAKYYENEAIKIQNQILEKVKKYEQFYIEWEALETLLPQDKELFIQIINRLYMHKCELDGKDNVIKFYKEKGND